MKKLTAAALAVLLLLALGCSAPAAQSAPAPAEAPQEGLSGLPFPLVDTTYALWRGVKYGDSKVGIQVLQIGQTAPITFSIGGNEDTPASLIDLKLNLPDGGTVASSGIAFNVTDEVPGYDMVAEYTFYLSDGQTLPDTATLFRTDKDEAYTLDLHSLILADAAEEQPAEAAATEEPAEEPTPEPTAMPAMQVTSAGITDGAMGLAYGAKGTQFTADGIPSLSLPLRVDYLPAEANYIAWTVIDPDGGDWVHWLAANMQTSTLADIEEDASIQWADVFVQGKNDFGFTGYGGPTPPSGVHTYVITVYALADRLELSDGFTLSELQQAIDGKVLAEATVTGTYAH